MTHANLVLAEDHLKNLALAVARNRAGAEDPIEEVLAREGVDPMEFERVLQDPIFKVYVLKYTKELADAGVSIRLKAQVLFESSLKEVYYIASDPEQPAMARLKATELLSDWAGVASGAPAAASGPVTPQFSITFNMPTVNGAPSASITVEGTAPTATGRKPAIIDAESMKIDEKVSKIDVIPPPARSLDAVFCAEMDEGYE